MKQHTETVAEGVVRRHSRKCAAPSKRCTCKPSYVASVYSQRDRRRIRKTYASFAEAKGWRADAQTKLKRGELRAPVAVTLEEAANEWLDGAESGKVRNRSGYVYKPSVLRGYERSLRLRILPALGRLKLSDVRRSDVQSLVDRLLGEGLHPSTIRNTLNPLQALYRRELQNERVAINPTVGLAIPKSDEAEERQPRIVNAAGAVALLAALPDDQRAVWATAFYAGLRRGELRGLRWRDVDLSKREIHVRQSWDDKEGEIKVKSKAGRRQVPILAPLAPELAAHKLRSGIRDDAALVFGSDAETPFEPSTVRRRAIAAWAAAELGDVEPIGLHEARHTFASVMIAAGVNARAIMEFMGHATITITFDRYGHIMPGARAEAAAVVDAYLEAEAR